MPVTAGEYEVRKNDDGSFSVVNTKSGKVHSSHSTEDDAKHQKQLLYAVGHGWEPSHHSAPVVLADERFSTAAQSRVSTPQARTR